MDLILHLTPDWSEITKNVEWNNLHENVKRIEWAHVFKNESCVEMFENMRNLPNKLCISKFNRPDQGLLDFKTKIYSNQLHLN